VRLVEPVGQDQPTQVVLRLDQNARNVMVDMRHLRKPQPPRRALPWEKEYFESNSHLQDEAESNLEEDEPEEEEEEEEADDSEDSFDEEEDEEESESDEEEEEDDSDDEFIFRFLGMVTEIHSNTINSKGFLRMFHKIT
jgi:hypothetical protein